jgi:exopolysaccharide production protein ExoQ
MPPPIALLLTLAFVLILLRMEHKQDPELPALSWILTIWMLSISVKPLGVWFGWGAASVEAGSPIDRAFLLTLLGIGLILLIRMEFHFSASMNENILVFILISYGLISILWSGMPLISLKRWTRELVAIVMALLLYSSSDPRRTLASIIRRVTYIIIPLSFVLIKYYPAYGVEFGRWSGERMWVGVTTQKNGLGRLCIMSILFLIWTIYRRLRGREKAVHRYQTHFDVLLLLLSGFLLMGPKRSFTSSSTSAVALTISLIFLAGLIWLKKKGIIVGRSVLLIIVLFVVIYGTITPFLGRLAIWDISSALNRDETLTGRADIWAVLIPYVKARPLLGYGSGGFWTTDLRESIYSSAHNGYLDMILNSGFLGLFILAAFLLTCSFKAHRYMSIDHDWGCLFYSYLVMSIVHNIAESSIQTLASPLTAYILFFSFAATGGINESSVHEDLELITNQNTG